MEVPNTSSNNSNGSSTVDVPVQATQKIRITIAPNAGGFSISVMPRDSPVEVAPAQQGHGHRRGGPHCPRGMFPHPGMMRRCHQSPDSSAATPVHGGPHHHHHHPHFPHWRASSPYAAELEQFKSEGFHCIWWVEKLLIMYNGNVDEVRQVLNRKKNKKEAARQKWATELAQLHQIGFDRDWVNLRLLKKYDGDMETTLNKLMDYQNHINKAFTGPTQAELLKYKTQLEILHEAGHHRDRFLIYWLNRFQGNVDAVLAKLQKKQNRREAKMAKFAPQLEQLRQAGHLNDRCNARLLKAADGDVEKVLRVLNSKSSCPMRPGGWGRSSGAAAAESSTPADTEFATGSTPGFARGCSGAQDEEETLEEVTSFPWEFGGFPHHRRHHGHHGHGPHHGRHHGPHHHRGGHHHHGHHGHGPHHHRGEEHGPHHFGGGFGFPSGFGMPHCPSGMSFPHHSPFGTAGCPFGGPFQGEGHSSFSAFPHPHPHHGHFGGAHFDHRGPQPFMFPRKAEGEDFKC